MTGCANKLSAKINFSDDVMNFKDGSWCVDQQRKLGHLYNVSKTDVCLTESEVRRLHRHFYHSRDERFIYFIKRAIPEEDIVSNRSTISKVREACNICHSNAREPQRIRVSLPEEDFVLNRTAALVLMRNNSQTVLYRVDNNTKFNAADCLVFECTRKIWDVFVRIWINNYIGYTEILAAYQGPQFLSGEFCALCLVHGIRIKHLRVQSYNTIGIGELYRLFLPEGYNRVSNSHTDLAHDQIIKIPIRTANDTADPDRLVPIKLVFRILTKLSITTQDLLDQRTQFDALITVRNKMTKLVALVHVQLALKCSTPTAIDYDVRLNDHVMVYREKSKR